MQSDLLYQDSKPIGMRRNSDDLKHQTAAIHLDNVDPLKEDGRDEIPEHIRNLSPEARLRAEKALVRRIDLRLLPMLVLMYIMNYLDRNNIAAARLTGKVGLQKGLHLDDTQYQTCVSILFVGYLLMQVPSNLLLNKIGKPAIYLPTAMVIWGTISACTAAAQSYGGLIAIRFFLGVVEAAYFPGCLFFLSCWYTRKELALRTALLYAGSLISGTISGLIAAGITYGLDGAKGLDAWRWLFIIEGTITVVIAGSAYFVLPNLPATTPWLSDFERDLAIERLREDVGLVDWTSSEEQTFFHGFYLALKDPKVYLLMICATGIVSSGGVTNFFPTVVNTLGFNKIVTLLLTAPPYLLAVVSVSANAWHADRTGERYLHIVLPLCVSILAFILAMATSGVGPRYFAMMIMPGSFYASFVVTYAWISNSLPRPPAKRAAALAFINAVSNATSIYVSYLYQTKWKPRYTFAMSFNIGTAVMAILAATALKLLLIRLNKRLERGEHVEGAVIGEGSAANDAASKGGFRFLH